MELKCIFLIQLLLFKLVLSSSAQNYHHTVYLPPHPTLESLSTSVQDMAYWLEQASGKHFTILKTSGKDGVGIQLQRLEDATLPTTLKKQMLQDGQSFYLEIKGERSARIVGTGVNSFNNGIYTFLHELGFRWYMPGDAWTIIPKLNASNVRISKVYTPDFQNRYYFGTGGVAPIPGIDPENSFKKDYDIWNRRNRLSSDYAIKGHTGQAFYGERKKELDQHPEYFCHNKVNRSGRIDISNPAAVKLFANWALDQIKPGDRFPVIGVDPADGSGGKDDCLPSNMKQVKSWSDKYFWLANQVAEQAEKKEENALVQLYAYSSHAAPPQFDLHKNVYPVIIPYAFQDVADPEQYIDLWSRKMKGRSMGIYDYWNITQWSSDVPQFNIYSVPVKLKLWKQYKVSTINLESTLAKGPMGHAFWLASQMMWDTEQPFENLYKEFLDQCFGPAAVDIKRMYDRWSLNNQGAMEVSLSLNDLAAASAKTKDASIQQRIRELKAYVYYLNLYYAYRFSPTVQGYTNLIGYIYSIHHLRLLQTHALQARYIKAPAAYNKQSDKNIVAIENSKFKRLDSYAIENNFRKALGESTEPYFISKFRFDIKKALPVEDDNQTKYNPLYINGKNSYHFHMETSQRLRFKAGATKETMLTIKDAQDRLIMEKAVPGTNDSYENVDVQLPAGTYVLTFGAYYRKSRLVFPDGISFISSGKFYDNYRYPLQYIYVPRDVNEIVYSDGYGPGTNKRGDWIDPGGIQIKPELVKYSTYRVPVPPQYRGKIWILNIGHRNFKMLNIPDMYSLNRFTYKE